MSTLLSPALLQDLSRRRLKIHHARPRGGVGERPSRVRGPGLEFAEFRPYVSGDDIRSLDAQASLRAGTPVVREYTVNQQLAVTVVLDARRGMALGQPEKFGLARSLAAVFAYTGLSGGDVVQLACLGGAGRGAGAAGKLTLSARLSGQGRGTEALGWLAAQGVARSGGETLGAALRSLAPRLPRGGLCVLVSDLLDEDAPAALRPLLARGELLAVQVLSAQELDPSRLNISGPLQLLDAAAGGDPAGTQPGVSGVVVELDRRTLDAYRSALDGWNEALSVQITRQGGRLLSVSSDTPVEVAVRRELLGRGLLA